MFKWLRRALFALLSLLLIGFIYQTAMQYRDEGRYHAPGRMVDIGGGRRLNLDCRGTGWPTVLLETGLGAQASSWNDVMKGVEPLTRVCAYDRAGYGYSDPGPDPRTTNEIVGDLEKLLGASGEKGPFVLVGHSLGGFTIRVFAARHQAEVKGLIFVDSSHPEQIQRMPESAKRTQNAVNLVMQGFPFLCRVGVVRVALAWTGSSGEDTYLQSQPKFAHASVSELNAFAESGRQTQAASPTFGDLPIIVLTAGKDGTHMTEMYKLWRNEWQPELVRLSARGSQTIVEDSTHLIPMEKPQAVVQAVREMLAGIKPL